MTVYSARRWYRYWANRLWDHEHGTTWALPCPVDDPVALTLEAASISLDLAVAVRHQPTVDPVEAINRPRVVQESVAWA